MTYRALIFDMGGVLVRTADFTPRQRLATRFGMTVDSLMGLVFGHETGARAQLGLVSVEQHWEHVRQVLRITPQELKDFQDVFWSEDFLDTELVDALRGWHRTCRTALLSNAFSNLRHVVNDILKIGDIFDELIVSSEEHIIKPDARIYQLTLDRLGVSAAQAIFVDDMPHNVDGARAVGIHAIQYTSTPQILSEIDTLLQGG